MNRDEAIAFLRPAVDGGARVWADLGAGAGTFTAALANLLDDTATIHAVDSDPAALRQLRSLRLPHAAPTIVPVSGDVGELDGIAEIRDVRWDGVVMANVLHYFADPVPVLNAVAARLVPDGRVVLIEYDRTSANRWVPYPIPLSRARDLAAATGFEWGGVVAQRASRYQGTLYCAVLTRTPPEARGR
jgi:ubiquinone/menaquinone biosynthesis C-methylase UbiE